MWEAQILRAESMRTNDKSVMDIIGAQRLDPRDAVEAVDPDMGHAPIERWLQMALGIEEKQ